MTLKRGENSCVNQYKNTFQEVHNSAEMRGHIHCQVDTLFGIIATCMLCVCQSVIEYGCVCPSLGVHVVCNVMSCWRCSVCVCGAHACMHMFAKWLSCQLTRAHDSPLSMRYIVPFHKLYLGSLVPAFIYVRVYDNTFLQSDVKFKDT